MWLYIVLVSHLVVLTTQAPLLGDILEDPTTVHLKYCTLCGTAGGPSRFCSYFNPSGGNNPIPVTNQKAKYPSNTVGLPPTVPNQTNKKPKTVQTANPTNFTPPGVYNTGSVASTSAVAPSSRKRRKPRGPTKAKPNAIKQSQADTSRHTLIDRVDEGGYKVKARCADCYRDKKTELGYGGKPTSDVRWRYTFCPACKDQPTLCVQHFYCRHGFLPPIEDKPTAEDN